jgi:hypothetical protein
MPIDSLGQLEERIQESHDLNPQQNAELLRLLSGLKREFADLSTTHADRMALRMTSVSSCCASMIRSQARLRR